LHVPPALLVLLVASTKIHLEEQALVAGTRQSSQADKAGRLTWQVDMAVRMARQSGLPALFCASYYCFLFQVDYLLTKTSRAIYFSQISMERAKLPG